MTDHGKIFRKITLRIEIYVFIAIVPLIIYFVFFSGNYSDEKIKYLAAGVVSGAVVSFLLAMLLRYQKLRTIFSSFGDEDKISEVKLQLLHYPKFEIFIAIFRWICAVLIMITTMNITAEMTILENMPILLLPFFAAPITLPMVYYIGHNMLHSVMERDEVRNALIANNQIRHFSIVGQVLLMITTVFLVPTVMLGYFFFLSSYHKIEFTNVPIHISFITFFSLLLISISLYEFAKGTRRQMSQIVDSLEKISGGRLNIKQAPVNSRDEIGTVTIHVNILLKKLNDVIQNVSDLSHSVTSSSSDINNSSQSLSVSANQQAASVEEISSSIEETKSTIEQNTENAGEAEKLAETSYKLAQEGTKVVQNAVDAINEINEMSKKISDIITVINDITFQTNLLALNAAVEAARAGEHGRGFAVVAGEVRNLAQRSSNAAGEISELITNSVQRVEEGTKLANKSGESLKEIYDSISKVRQIMTEIYTASAEQKSGMDQITIAISQTDDITQQNAAAAEELSSTVENLNASVNELAEQISYFEI